LLQLEEGEYEVFVDSTLADGHLTYGELVLPGESTDEVLISCHCCHPSLANDNLSGMVLATFLARHLAQQPRHYTYRFLFVPGTIGAITWLALHETQAAKIQHGLVVACVGDPGQSTYKRSRRGKAMIDRAVEHVLHSAERPYEILDFSPYGYDERQYCSPGFNLAVGSLTRTPHGRFPEYHTSADNLDFVQPESLANSLTTYLTVLNILENNRIFINQKPKCEPQLGKRGLYGSLGGGKSTHDSVMAMLWVLNLSDGENCLLDIAERANMEFELVRLAAEALAATDLLIEMQNDRQPN
jgi:aminopeptidase-like protein